MLSLSLLIHLYVN